MESFKTGRAVEVTGSQSESLARERRDSNTFGPLQLSEAVAMHLRERIVSGQLAKGEFLRIDALANALGVSTTPVREGLLLLQSESSVTFLPRRGFVVNGFSKDDLHDLFWAQATLAAELAGRATPKDVSRLILRASRLSSRSITPRTRRATLSLRHVAVTSSIARLISPHKRPASPCCSAGLRSSCPIGSTPASTDCWRTLWNSTPSSSMPSACGTPTPRDHLCSATC